VHAYESFIRVAYRKLGGGLFAAGKCEAQLVGNRFYFATGKYGSLLSYLGSRPDLPKENLGKRKMPMIFYPGIVK